MGFIRVLLAISVMLEHIYGHSILIDGQTAVLAFFIISGFYMNMIISEQYQSSRTIFLINRALRIYPTYFVVFSLTIIFSYYTHTPHIMINPAFSNEMSTIELIWYRITNVIILGQDITSSLSQRFHNAYNNPITPGWTLASELVFYMIINLLPLKKAPRIIFLLMIAIISLWLRTYISGSNRYPSSTIVFFMAGALSYYLYDYFKNLQGKIETLIGSLLFILASAFICFQPLKDSLPYITVSDDKQHLLFFIMICFSIPFIFKNMKHSVFDRFIGDLSYPIYVSHMFCIFAYGWLFPYYSRLGWSGGTTIIVVTISLSCMLNFLIEKPIEFYRKKIKKYHCLESIHSQSTSSLATDYEVS